MEKQSLNGIRFGRLTVLREDETIVSISAKGNKNYSRTFFCQCDCGRTKVIRYSSLVNGGTNSCGCLRRELTGNKFRKHGHHDERLYVVWERMNARCNSPTDANYKHYGGRGIRIANEWKDYLIFREWALANGYDETAKKGQCTLDRINPNGNYEPNNCRWVNMKEQGRNKRTTIFLSFNGIKKPMVEWAEDMGIPYERLRRRIKYGNWSIERALTTH